MPSVDVTPPNICDPMAIPPLPTLPTGVSITAALPVPSVPFSVRLCCKVLQYDPSTLIPVPPIVSGSLLLTAAVAFNGYVTIINNYLRLLPVRCPKDA